MLQSILRSHDKVEELPNCSKTTLRVTMKMSKKAKEPKGNKRPPEDEKSLNRVDKNKATFGKTLQLPIDERLRRRLSDSLELQKQSSLRVRRRSVSFDPLTVFKTAILDNDAEAANNVLISGKVSANTSLDGVLPIVLAAKDGCAECLELLIERGANIDVTDKHGLTPLEIAVREGQFDCAQVLISAGANANSIRDGYFDESIETANKTPARNRSRTI